MSKQPLLPLAAMFAAGIFMAEYLASPVAVCFGVAAAAIILAMVSRNRKIASGAVLIAALATGALHWRQQKQAVIDPSLAELPTYSRISIVGVADSPPQFREHSYRIDLHLRAVQTESGWKTAKGRLRVTVPLAADTLQPFDRAFLTGNLVWPLPERNPGDFNYQRYLQANGIQATLRVRDDGACVRLGQERPLFYSFSKALLQSRAAIGGAIDSLFTPDVAPVLHGLLLGDRSEIDASIRDNFARSGVIHVLAVSGLHVGFIMLIFWAIAGILRIPQRFVLIFVLAGIWLYALLTGMKPPVLRASIMATFFLIGRFRDRPLNSANLLAAAALAILVLRPGELFQAGFQLSFSAVAGILYFYPKIETAVKSTEAGKWLLRWPPGRWAVGLLIVSLAAQMGTLPFSATHFGRVSIIGIAANLVVIPAIFVAVATAFVALVCLPFSTMLALTYGAVAHVAIRFVMWMTQKMSALSWASADHWYPAVWILLLYVAALFLLFEWKKPSRRFVAALAILLVLNGHVWAGVLRGGPKLVVTMIDIGQGDAALVEFPTGKTLLIDAGPSAPGYDTGERMILPFLARKGIHRIDVLLISHPHLDHLGGAGALIRNFRVGQAVFADTLYASAIFQDLLHRLYAQGIPVRVLKRGNILDDFLPAQVWVMGPSPENSRIQRHLNDASLVVKVSYGKTTFLFTGDTELKGEDDLLGFANLLQTQVLKVGHHGSDTSTGESFVDAVGPRWSTLSLGALNRFDHPTPVVTQRLAAAGSDTLRTDLLGALVFESDGKQVRRVR